MCPTGIPLGICSRDPSWYVFPSETFFHGYRLEISLGNSSRNPFYDFIQNFLWGFAPGFFKEVSSRNSSGDFFREFVPGISSEISPGSSSGDFVQEFVWGFRLKINEEVPWRILSRKSFGDFFGEFIGRFAWGFAAGISPEIASRNSSRDIPQELRISPEILSRIWS